MSRGQIGSAMVRLFCVLCSLAIPTGAYAQASIAGSVKDESGAVLPGVTVEAASAALIEKVRTTVTDGTGQYRITDLRPGVYTVTFSLSGFNSSKREGVQLEGTFTASVNMDLKVGNLTETIVVSGEAPVVDVQSSKRQMTVSNEVLNQLPTARAYAAYALLIPGVTVAGGVSNVQSTVGMVVFAGAGGRNTEGKMMVDGLNVGLGGSVSLYNADLSNAAELTMTTSGGLGENESSGPAMNVVPKTGGNTIHGTVFGSYTPNKWVASNYTDALQKAGLAAPGEFLKIWDHNGGIGGPIKKDHIWFFANIRFVGAYQTVPGLFANANAGDPNTFAYSRDTTRQAAFANSYNIASGRITYQVTPRNKVSGVWDEQIPCNGGAWSNDSGGCRGVNNAGVQYVGGFSPNPLVSPEAATYLNGHQRVQQVSWTSNVTNRVLAEAAYGDFINNWGSFVQPGSPVGDLISVTELATGLRYRSPVSSGSSPQDYYFGNYTWRASVSYVPGAHLAKFGYVGYYQTQEPTTFTDSENGGNILYSFQNGQPFQITEQQRPTRIVDKMRYDAFYAQDQWTLRRLTLQGALRYDHLWVFRPDQQIGPTRFLPTAIVFPGDQYPGARFNDLTPRMGAAYDLFGNGKTSLKVNLGKYLELSGLTALYSGNNPMSRLAGGTTTRRWDDLNGNRVPDCDLSRVTAQSPATTGSIDNCGALSNAFFGTNRFTTDYDSNVINGWSARPSDWNLGVSVQQQLLPRVSMEAGYYRRWLANFAQTRNVLVQQSDFHPFSVQVPADARLGVDAGRVLTGLYTVDPQVAGQANSTVVPADSLGSEYLHYNGVTITITARPRSGLTLQGGLNAGRTVQDNCDIRAHYPEASAGPGTTPSTPISTVNPYCHIDQGFLTRVTGFGSYVVPKVDVLVSGTFRSDRGNALEANQAGILAPSGQAFLGLSSATVNYLTPYTQFGDRVNELDFNFSKVLRFGQTKAKVGIDLYNLPNLNPVLTYNTTYGPAWLTPLSVMTARYGKLSVQFDF